MFALPQKEALEIVVVLAGGEYLSVLSTTLPQGTTEYPSVTALVPAADWYEREIHDLYGIVATGHPDLNPLVLPLPPGAPAPGPGRGTNARRLVPSTLALPALVQGEGIFTIPYGPVRSGVFESVEYVVETPGEDIPRIRTRPHYKHRGVEAAFVGRPVDDGVLLAEGVEGVASVAHAIAYCEAVEQVARAEIPLGAQLIRVLHAELERIANHLDSTIRHCEGAGQAVAFARFTLHKERVMQLRSKLCGSRFGRGVVIPGGVTQPRAIDPTQLFTVLDPLARDIGADVKLLMATPSFIDRLRGTGVLPLPLAAAHGALGPIGRGSGMPEDVRASRPYGGYRQLGFAPASREDGDALARQLVRNDEMASSLHLVRQTADELEFLADGAWAAPIEDATGDGLGWAESPQGEVIYLVRLEGGMLARARPRAASFHNLSLFTAAFPKDITTDFAFIEASFGLSIAGAAL
jgi:Ni,Fe-hydrogenase III large subunit